MIDYEKLMEKLNELPWRGVLIVVAVAFVIASVVSNIFSWLLIPAPPPDRPTSAQVSRNMEIPSGSESLSDAEIKAICDRNLFNNEESCPGIEAQSDDSLTSGTELAKSDLPVKIVGLIYGGTPYNGLATILNTEKNKINSFIVGDLLMKDAKVEEIRRTRVILVRQGGRREYIELVQEEILRSKRRRNVNKATSPDSISPIAKGPPPNAFSEEGFERTGNEMKMTSQYKEQLLSPSNFSKVLQDAKATPNIVDGQVKGFRITRIREGSVYLKAGFQNDDVILEINGEPLNNAAAAIRTLQSLRNENDIEVLVNRGGNVFPMRLNIQ